MSLEDAAERFDRIPWQRLQFSVVSHNAQRYPLAGPNVQLLSDFFGQHDLSFG